MRIAINALSVQSGGGLSFLKNLLKNLFLIDHKNEYLVLVTETKANNLLGSNGEFPNVRKVVFPDQDWISRSFWEQTVMPRLLRQEKVDILYAPGNQGPILCPFPFVVLVQTVDPLLKDKGQAPLALRMKWEALRIGIRESVIRARKVIAISQYMRRLLMEQFEVSPEKVAVVPHGIPEDTGPKKGNSDSYFVERYQIETPYFLAVSDIRLNKNYETLVKSFALALGRIPGVIHLFIAGKVEDRTCFSRIKNLVRQNNLSSRIHFLGAVDSESLATLYREAQGLIFPSRWESFGLPPLEAMAYGVPVAASRIDPVLEVCGDAVFYFDPDDAEEMAQAMMRLLVDTQLRNELVRRGLVRAQQFSWKETARQTLKILEEAR